MPEVIVPSHVREYAQNHGIPIPTEIPHTTVNPLSNTRTGDRLFEVMGWWNEGVNQSKHGYLLMGKSIYFMKKERLWKKEIEHMPSFKYWVEHSLHISVAQAHRLSQIYQKYGVIIENIPIDISKITLLLPYLEGKTEEEKIAMITMASECTVEDIKNNIREMTGHGVATDVCSHSDTELITRCKTCKKWLK